VNGLVELHGVGARTHVDDRVDLRRFAKKALELIDVEAPSEVEPAMLGPRVEGA
jgi:hypothetical protein